MQKMNTLFFNNNTLYNQIHYYLLSRHMAFDGRTDHVFGMKIKVHMPRSLQTEFISKKNLKDTINSLKNKNIFL